jgi:hypothetical protein
MSSRSGAEVREALFNGQPVSWGFNPKEKRVVLTFPKALGGETYILCIAGYYTFVARPTEGQIPEILDALQRAACVIEQPSGSTA